MRATLEDIRAMESVGDTAPVEPGASVAAAEVPTQALARKATATTARRPSKPPKAAATATPMTRRPRAAKTSLRVVKSGAKPANAAATTTTKRAR